MMSHYPNLLLLLIMMTMLLSINMILTHPLIMGISLLMYSMIMSISMNKYFNSFWYSMIVHLVIIGGLMILFLYFISLTSNSLIFFPKYFKLTFFLKMLMILFMMMILMKNIMNIEKIFYLINSEISKFYELFYFKINFYYTSKLIFSSSFFLMTLITLIYLLITLIYVTKICSKSNFPMRSNFF
uniref:NADH dehydrogenase subunit 6 n=1 Tax=Taeniogonalos tricolor TaxID=2491144 RepID=A0A3S8V1C5_9HYME|nr:NADH dehydrogenase subunit 6 [Taeniogonalos tricolor]